MPNISNFSQLSKSVSENLDYLGNYEVVRKVIRQVSLRAFYVHRRAMVPERDLARHNPSIYWSFESI